MIKHTIFLAISLILLSNSVSGMRVWGIGCPTQVMNMAVKDFNLTNMMGLWYEYLISPDLLKEEDSENMTCSTWLMMQNQPNDTYFSVIQNQLDPK